MNRNARRSALVTVLLALLSGCNVSGTSVTTSDHRSTKTDVEFAKSAFNTLAKGDQSVADDIDWENFTAAGQNVGTSYKSFSDEPNRAAFRKAFITSFSKSFHATGASAESLTNWKTQHEGANESIVAGETLKKTHLLITVSKKDGIKKMVGILNGP